MDSPFFRSRWDAPSYPLYYRGVPVQGRTVAHTPMAASRSPKVVSIPVQFVEPEKDRSGSALKIQKVFRGFLVRKSVRRIAALRREVEEIEMRVSDPEVAEMMRRDPREKLRVSEMLMNVLLRLDSVRGVDSGVRDCRKAVIRRAIALQEKVDELVAVGAEPDAGGSDNEAEDEADNLGAVEPESSPPEAAEGESESPDGTNSDLRDESAAEADAGVGGGLPMVEMRAGGEEGQICGIRENGERVDEVNPINGNAAAEIGAADGPTLSTGVCSGSGEDGTESQTDSTDPPKSLIEAEEECGSDTKEGEDEEVGGGGERRRNNKEMLEKMMEDNEKMMKMMAELSEKNEGQTRLLTALSQRVEQLERAFVCDKLRRKKRRQAGGGGCPADCSESSPDPKKCAGRSERRNNQFQ